MYQPPQPYPYGQEPGMAPQAMAYQGSPQSYSYGNYPTQPYYGQQAMAYQSPMPIAHQPMGFRPRPYGNWMPPPIVAPPPGCPPGLEYLAELDNIMCQQVVEMMEVLTGWETCNRYIIRNAYGQQIFYAFEESNNPCMRNCCRSDRGFVLHIVNNAGEEIMRVNRKFLCCGDCCNACCCTGHCARNELEVESPPGNFIGRVGQISACCALELAIYDEASVDRLRIRGPATMCTWELCGNVHYDVIDRSVELPVGRISKIFSGFAQEVFTDADNFGITFPMNLDIKLKALLIGAVFLVDFMAFEDNQQAQGGSVIW